MKNILAFLSLFFLINTHPMNYFSNAKNKTIEMFNSLQNTIKADLGFSPADSSDITSLEEDFKTAFRLECYSFVSRIALFILISRFVSIQPQFERKPDPFTSVITAPLLEEYVFTYGISRSLGTYGPVITPFLFGAVHIHKDPKTGAFLWLVSAIDSFFRLRNAHATAYKTWVPVFSHAMNNAFALYCSAG